ncbi:MAG: hypothetical protein K0R28_2974 [Paenibacillus sp.]|nr:hypothetical protein [Paenibacillus sp.]
MREIRDDKDCYPSTAYKKNMVFTKEGARDTRYNEIRKSKTSIAGRSVQLQVVMMTLSLGRIKPLAEYIHAR